MIHVIDPGNIPDGLFWTAPVPSDSVQVDLDKKNPTASLRVKNIATRDWGTLPNDFLHGPSVPATLSFDVQWKGLIKPVSLRDPVNRFVFEGVQDTAVLTCSASVPKQDFEFVSEAEGQQLGFAEIGHERNGVFFPKEDKGSKRRHRPAGSGAHGKPTHSPPAPALPTPLNPAILRRRR